MLHPTLCFHLIDFQGVTRVKSSSDVVGALLRELRLQVGSNTDGAFRLAVAVDGVNALWGRTTLKKEDKSEVLLFPYSCLVICLLLSNYDTK